MWKYWSFYFGNANWPSDALWRINPETGERHLLVCAGVGRKTVYELRKMWESFQEPSPDIRGRLVEPHYVSWDAPYAHGELHELRYWFIYDDKDAEQDEWDFGVRAGMGEGMAEETYSAGKPLYAD